MPKDVNKCFWKLSYISEYDEYHDSGVYVISSDPYLSAANSILETSRGFNAFNKLRHRKIVKLYIQNWPRPFLETYTKV